MITATNNENNGQTSATESGFSVSVSNKKEKMIKLKRNGGKYLVIYGVRRSTIEKLKEICGKKKELLFIDSLIYLKTIKIPYVFDLENDDEFEDSCHSEHDFDNVYIPNKIKNLYGRRRLIEIEDFIQSVSTDLMRVDLKYRSARQIKLKSEGEWYTVSDYYATKIENRLNQLRQIQCKELPFNSSGFQIDVKIGEKNYLARLLNENDRKTVDGRKNIKDGIVRIRELRNNIKRFNHLNNFGNIEKGTIPDVKQCYIKGRLYSFVSEIPREYRSAMYFMNLDGTVENVVEFDIKASHTNFLPQVLRNMLNNLNFNDYSFKFSRFDVGSELSLYDDLLMEVKISKSDIYTQIANDMKTTRNDIKVQWQEFVNDRKRAYRHKDNKVYKWFKNRFPNITEMIEQCHKLENNGTNDKTKWRNDLAYKFSIPYKLHELENRIMVRPACVEFLKNVTDVTGIRQSIITVHDSWMVKERSSLELKNTLEHLINYNSILSFIQIKECNIKLLEKIFHMYMGSTCANSTQNDDTSNASTSGTCGTSDAQEKKTKRKTSTISEMRPGCFQVKINGIRYCSVKTLNGRESKDEFKDRILKELGLQDGDIKC